MDAGHLACVSSDRDQRAESAARSSSLDIIVITTDIAS